MNHHGGAPGGVVADGLPVVALVGRPNVGKSTFLARASGRYAEVANVAGTTVDLEARVVSSSAGSALLVDLPGALSLVDRPAGGRPFWQLLLEAAPDAVLVVADAGDLERHLPLALACRDLGLPIVVAANLSDEAGRRGADLDTGALAQRLCAPVVRTVGRDGTGVSEAVDLAVGRARRRQAVLAGRSSPRSTVPAPAYSPAVEARLSADAHEWRHARSLGAAAATADPLAALVAAGRVSPRGAAAIGLADVLAPERIAVARAWAAAAVRHREVRRPFADRLAAASVRPLTGIPLLVIVLAATFAIVAIGGSIVAGALSAAWSAFVSPLLHTVVGTVVPVPGLGRAVLAAVDDGLLAMLAVGIPYVLAFTVLVAMLEDSGYLASLTVLTDRALGAVGLPGRAAIPLLVAAGCNVPAIYATRVLATRRERVLAAFLATLVPCSARSAVVLAALTPLAGPWAAAGAFAIVTALTVGAGLGANALLPGRQSPLVLDLAPFRVPVPRLVAGKAWVRFESFVRTATPIMLLGSFALGLAWEAGVVAAIVPMLQPLTLALLGLPAVAGVAIVFGVLRKELTLQLLLVLAAAAAGGPVVLRAILSPGQALVFAVVTSVSLPCIATFSALAAELGRRIAVLMSAASIGLALVAGAVLARLVGIA